MGTVSVSLPSDGTVGFVTQYNTPINTIVNEINGNLNNANIASGAAIDPTKIAGGNAAMLSPGVSWTPTWTNFTVGNSVVTAKYVQIGKIVHYRVNLIFGSTSALTASGITLSTPVTAVAYGNAVNGAFPTVGQARYEDVGGVAYIGPIDMPDVNTLRPLVSNAGSSFVNLNSVTSTIPFGFGTGDEMTLTGVFEAA